MVSRFRMPHRLEICSIRQGKAYSGRRTGEKAAA
jgi:hypothetical protein